MQQYDEACAAASRQVTRSYSTSFGLAITLLPKGMRQHIYNIYGLVRVADEIVDTYTGKDKKALLDSLEAETYAALSRRYSPNALVHAFMLTANTYGINKELIKPFFASMRSDITKLRYSKQEYETYIYGSAEVVGLMCLRVFCAGDEQHYRSLQPGARALGAAFQKVNFLRDFAADYATLHRIYFPDVHFETFDDSVKEKIIADIQADFVAAKPAIRKLPREIRASVQTANDYFEKLLMKIGHTPAATIKQQRVRISNTRKTAMLAKAFARRHLRK